MDRSLIVELVFGHREIMGHLVDGDDYLTDACSLIEDEDRFLDLVEFRRRMKRLRVPQRREIWRVMTKQSYDPFLVNEAIEEMCR